jgi:hypothetical protein
VGKRWSDDERGRGVASAASLAPGVEELLAAAKAADWVAEEPESHLLHHIHQALEVLPLDLVETRVTGEGVFEIDLRLTYEAAGQGFVREVVFAIVGSFAESATSVRQRTMGGGGLVFEVVTGLLDGDGQFAPHGHTVRLRIK